MTVTVSDGNAFKSVIGDQTMTPGGRYFFEVQIKAGYLIKIGVCRGIIEPEKVRPFHIISHVQLDDIINFVSPPPLRFAHQSIFVQQAFSDSEGGWAFYNGELRHGSNNDGTKYGEAVSPGDIIVVMFDTIEVSYHYIHFDQA